MIDELNGGYIELTEMHRFLQYLYIKYGDEDTKPSNILNEIDDFILTHQCTNAIEDTTAEWVGVNPLTDTLQCSNCSYNIIDEEFVTPFCPECRARMTNVIKTDDGYLLTVDDTADEPEEEVD